MMTMTYVLRLRVTLLLALLATWLALAGTAAAQDEKKLKEARERYEKGQAAYNLGRFDEAIAEFEKGYIAKPDPVFLFNIAQSYRQISNFDKAIFFYKRYLGTAKDAPNRADVEHRIVELEGLKKKEELDKLKTEKEKTEQEKADKDRADKERQDKERLERERLEGEKGKVELEKLRLEKERLEKERLDRLEREKAEKDKAAAAGAGGGAVAMVGGGSAGAGSGVSATSTQGSVSTTAPFVARTGPIRVRVAGAPALVDFSDELKNTPFGSYWLGGAYVRYFGKLALELGVDANVTWIIYNAKTPDPQPGDERKIKDVTTAGPWLAGYGRVAARYSLTSKFLVGLELGAGVIGWQGLNDGNPFTPEDPKAKELGGVAATGIVAMASARVGLGIEMAITPGLTVFVMPAITVVDRPDNLRDTINDLTKVELILGVAYTL
jgi:tetratricopeptide (TPR) repeat protein